MKNKEPIFTGNCEGQIEFINGLPKKITGEFVLDRDYIISTPLEVDEDAKILAVDATT
jgi:hypothetical protein